MADIDSKLLATLPEVFTMADIDSKLLAKLPKKHHKYINALYKEYDRYSAVIMFDDGFCRSIGEWNFSELKAYIKDIIEVDRAIEY